MRKTVIDMTHTLNNDVAPWPGSAAPVINRIGSVANGDYCQILKYTMTTHTGTHMDCQTHMVEKGYYTDTQDMSFFIGKGLVIDCRDKVHDVNGNAELGMDMFDGVDLTDVDFIFPYLGWADNWGTSKFFENYPCIDAKVAKFLGQHKTVRGIGMETPGVDPVPRETFDIHKIYLANEKTIFENLTNVDKLIGKKFTFIGLPLKFEGGDGSPIRAVAVLDD